MMLPRERRQWTLADFRAMKSGVSDEVLRPLLKICNVAIKNGLTRKQVEDTFSRLHKQYPAELPVAILIEELSEQLIEVEEKGEGR